jgi:glycosyltransferase involved in cell wall biosynthesis
MQNKISVIIITGNEEKNLRDCLISVNWADEIIVVDSESTDSTVKIAKEFTDKVFIRKWDGFVPQKTYALSLAKNDWILSLDADERVTPELANEISSMNLASNKFDAYKIHRDNYFIGKKITSCGWGSDYQLRLFKKSKIKLTDRLVHERFIVEGNVFKLKNSMTHYSYLNLKDGFKKINEYSTLEANEKYLKKRVAGISIVFKPVIAFLHHYLLKKGFADGKHGLIVSLMHAMTKLQVQMKMWELKKINNRNHE